MTAPAHDTHITFKLWNIVTSLRDGRRRCTLDAVTIGECQLREADFATMNAFLAAAGIVDSLAVSWNIQYFSTPYYSDYPLGLDWRDRLAMTWRVAIEYQGPVEKLGFMHFGPIGVEAWDPTFADDDEDWSRNEEQCIVIGESDDGQDLSFLNRMGCEFKVENLNPASSRMNRISIDLGRLDLPSEMEKVDNFTNALKAHNVRTNWKETLSQSDR